jgi:Protein of unknown function (DUF3631)
MINVANASQDELDAAALANDARQKPKKEKPELPGRKIELPEPEPCPDPVDGASLLNELAGNVRDYMVMSEAEAAATALWVVHTYTLEACHISPRLAITSPQKGCGKSTLIDWLTAVTLRPLKNDNISAATVYRVIEAAQPTLLIDEGDSFLGERDELRGILNSGHRKGGNVLRVVGDGANAEVRQFATWAACAIALIGKLADTLHDRSIHIKLQRKRADERPKQLRLDRPDPDLVRLSRQCARWATDNCEAIHGIDPDMPASLFNRQADNWRPLLAIADAAGGKWPAKARAAALALSGQQADDSESIDLLADVRAYFDRSGSDRVFSKVLASELASDPERPWAEYNRGKSITQTQIANLLRPFRIISETIRIGEERAKGYLRVHCEDVFDRYLAQHPPSEPLQRDNPDEMGTSERFSSVTEKSTSRIEKWEKPNNDGHRHDVTAEKGGSRGNGGGNGAEHHPCVQCNGHDNDAILHVVGKRRERVWLHRECYKFYLKRIAGLS